VTLINYTVNLGGLSFTQASTDYQLVGTVEPAGRSQRRTAVSSANVAGETLLQSVAEMGRLRMTIRCYGGGSNPQTLVDAIVTKIEQMSWNLAVTWDGASRTWKAEPADWTCPIEGDDALTHRRVITINVPVQPFPS
jgi:hypothetical protein